MKTLYRLLILALAAGSFAACSDEGKGAGDAVIGFEEAEYYLSESQTSYVRIPVKVTGEPKKYPIVFNVTATPLEGMDNLSDHVKITQTDGLKYKGNPDVPACIELEIIDDNEINATRSFSLNIVSASGAQLGNSATTIYIEDDDDAAYKKLVGDWTFTATGLSSGETVKFDVTLTQGFTADEVDDNAANDRLICWGFGDEHKEYSGVTPSHQAIWYLTFDKSSNDVSIMLGTLMTTKLTFEMPDGSATYSAYRSISASFIPADLESGELNYGDDEGATVTGSWDSDYNTISFTPTSGFGALILGGNSEDATDWNITGAFFGDIYYNIVLTRK